MTFQEIISHLPYSQPFIFVDELFEVDENGIRGSYTFDPNHEFYKGHFKDNPVTPGVILIETMAQVGLVSLGIYLLSESGNSMKELKIALTSSAIDFYKPVFPGEKVMVISKKEYFRFNKLKCHVEMFNEKDELVCRGTIAGMIHS